MFNKFSVKFICIYLACVVIHAAYVPAPAENSTNVNVTLEQSTTTQNIGIYMEGGGIKPSTSTTLPTLGNVTADAKITENKIHARKNADSSTDLIDKEKPNYSKDKNMVSPENSTKSDSSITPPASAIQSTTIKLPASSISTSTTASTTTIRTTSVRTTSTTTTTPKPTKPLILFSLEEDSDQTIKVKPVAQGNQEPVLNVANLVKPRGRADYIAPVIVTIFFVPMFVGLLVFSVRKVRDYWEKRHYRRMDFLIDGMYND